MLLKSFASFTKYRKDNPSIFKKEIANSRKEILEILIKYIIGKIENNKQVNLNFICTHNSRRSQFCQIWSSTASQYYNIPVNCYSGVQK